MGSGDDKRHSRSTVRFDSEQLAKLTREAKAADPAPADAASAASTAVAASAELLPATSRAATLHDPMTMALLAEVARNSKTVDFDPERIAELVDEAEHADALPADPSVKRRGT